MKTIVAYYSVTGNTGKVAEAIFGEIAGEKDIKELSELNDLEGYDLAFVGFPIMAFGPAQPAREFLEANATGKKIALFITHAAPEGMPEVGEWLEKCRDAAAGAEIVGMFDCQGELAQNVIESLLKSDNQKMRSFGEQGASTKGQPDESRLEKARAFAREVMGKFQD